MPDSRMQEETEKKLELDQEDPVDFIKAKASSEFEKRVKGKRAGTGTKERDVSPLYPDRRLDDLISQSSGFTCH